MRSSQERLNLPNGMELAWFFGSILVLSVPLWILGALSGAFILPGLPVSALSALIPALAATIVVLRSCGHDGLQGFWGQLLARPRLGWIILAAALPAVLACCSLAFMLTTGRDVPDPVVTTIGFIGLVAVFLPPAIGEEMGWSGFAATALVARFGVVGGGLICGSFEILWHLPPFDTGTTGTRLDRLVGARHNGFTGDGLPSLPAIRRERSCPDRLSHNKQRELDGIPGDGFAF